MSIFKQILLGILAIFIVILVAGLFQSNSYRVERSITIAAPAAEIFAKINDLHQNLTWSPWMKLDPAAKLTFEGPANGVGASNSWVGNSQMGSGRQTIIASTPGEVVKLRLEFFKPMAGEATSEFRLLPTGSGTTVTWSMYGPKNYVSKVMCMFMSMDKMIGGYFEQGLASLKAQAEKK